MPVEILAVDDNPANLCSLQALLGGTGATVVEAHSGDEALWKLLQRDVALILLDIQMPNLDGYETARLIRSRERSRFTPIIFVTAHHRTEEHALQGYALGAVDYLSKPIVPEVLKAKVGFFLELYRKTQESRHQGELLRQAERREHERALQEERQKYERALLRAEMERERRGAERLSQRAEELTRLVEEKEAAQRALHLSYERLQLAADTASRLLLEPEPSRLLGEVFGRLSGSLGLELFLRYQLSEGGERMALVGSSGLEPEPAALLAQVALPAEGLLGQVAAQRQRAVLEDPAALDPLMRALGASALAVFPLQAGGRLLGALALGSRTPRTLTADELSLMQVLCDQVAAALERARLIEELKETDRRKDEFLAMLGHELRNPLAPIRSSLEVFRARLAGDPTLQRTIGAAERQVRHMVRLVDDLLDVSRITRGKVELRRERVELGQVVDQAITASEPIVRLRKHELTLELPPDQVLVNADPTRLAQIFSNLLQNAAKYTEPGGKIHFAASVEGPELVVRVRDTGIGIREEMLTRIFDLFVQDEPSSDRAAGGLGLGLTLVKSLVEMHGGSVRAASDGPGLGSEFVVRMPLAPAGAEAGPPPAPAPGAAHSRRSAKLNIVLVDDNPDIRLTMRDLLELHGHRVVEAPDGVKAVELVLRERPNVALVDIGLPGMDGYRVAELVRASAGAASTRLVALTGYGAEDARRRALEAGFDAHLVKPITAEDLFGLLDRLC